MRISAILRGGEQFRVLHRDGKLVSHRLKHPYVVPGERILGNALDVEHTDGALSQFDGYCDL